MIATKTKLDTKTEKRLKTLGNRYWRLNHLYYIKDEDGNRVLFKMNRVQKMLYFGLWWRNIFPKARQHGVTTVIELFLLDACIFNSNVAAGIIAHTLEMGTKIFREKVKYAYDNLPDDLKDARTLVKDDTKEIIFNNGSFIYVSTSMRSGTLQYLHVSEYAWICTHDPKKAAEIKAGAMETVHSGGIQFIEATYEGPLGDFPVMCADAEVIRCEGRELGELDYKIQFFGWDLKDSNRTDPRFVELTTKDTSYYDKLEKTLKRKIDPSQRAWHTAKKRTLKHLMFKEHPSTFEEASIASVEGAYHAEYMAEMREHGRICKVPHLPAYPVFTVNDLGVGGHMPWIFFQIVGLECHIIDCFSLSDKDDTLGGAPYFKRMLDGRREEFRYSYGKYFCPFDVNKGEIGLGQTIYNTFKQHGIVFEVLPLESNVIDGIQRLQKYFPIIYIDAEKCQPLIQAWSCYHREWLENLSRYDIHPHKDKSEHWADAGRYLSMVLDKKLYLMDDRAGMPRQQYAEVSCSI